MKTLRAFRFIAWTTLIITVALAIAWWTWGVQVLRGLTPQWDSQFSQKGFWETRQVALRNNIWQHDDGWEVAMYGGKEWAEYMIRKIKDGREYSSCEHGHQDQILGGVTNQVAVVEKENQTLQETEAAWLAWWKENSTKSQEEWIRDGFTKAGFSVSLPPVKEDWPMLLKILGASAGPSTLPRGRTSPLYADLRYNAYRWLRDSGFEPVRFTLDHKAALSDGDIRGGLLDYQTFDRRIHHLVPPPGRLSFASDEFYDYKGLQLIWPFHTQTLDRVSFGIFCAGMAAALFLLLSKRVGSGREKNIVIKP